MLAKSVKNVTEALRLAAVLPVVEKRFVVDEQFRRLAPSESVDAVDRALVRSDNVLLNLPAGVALRLGISGHDRYCNRGGYGSDTLKGELFVTIPAQGGPREFKIDIEPIRDSKRFEEELVQQISLLETVVLAK